MYMQNYVTRKMTSFQIECKMIWVKYMMTKVIKLEIMFEIIKTKECTVISIHTTRETNMH